MEEEELICTKYKQLINAHLPIPELNRKEAIDNDDEAGDVDDHDIDDDDDDHTHQEGGE